MFDLNGKRALVTGATQGIGFAVAQVLAGHGAQVYVGGGSDPEKCSRAAAQLPGARPAFCDLALPDCAGRLYAQTGEIDILVLNASIQIRAPWDRITPEQFERQVKVNWQASLALIKAYAPGMHARGWGRILTIGSVQQYKPHPDMLVYAGTKAAQMSMVQNLAKQLASSGVTVNNLSPGVIATPRNQEALADPVYEKRVLSGIPAGYAGQAQDCAGGALLLCSEEGRYITGTDLLIDGGMHL